MSKTHDPIKHTYATVATMRDDGPLPIVLHCGAFVFLAGSHAMLPVPGNSDIRQVGDGRCNAFDEQGNCIISVPASLCEFWTDEEADCISRSMDADAELLANAH